MFAYANQAALSSSVRFELGFFALASTFACLCTMHWDIFTWRDEDEGDMRVDSLTGQPVARRDTRACRRRGERTHLVRLLALSGSASALFAPGFWCVSVSVSVCVRVWVSVCVRF